MRSNASIDRTIRESAARSLPRRVSLGRSAGSATVIWFLAAVLLPAPIQPADLVGLWESTTTSRGGIGQAFEFRSDGTCAESTTVIVDGYYRLIGDHLVQGEKPPGPDADTSKSIRITIDGDVLTATGPDGSIIQKERIGGKTASTGLVGSWRYHHYTNAVAFERYTADGRMSFRLPMVSSVGRCTMQDGKLTLVRQDQPDATMTIGLEGGVLTLEGGGKLTHYRRSAAGPWYGTGSHRSFSRQVNRPKAG